MRNNRGRGDLYGRLDALETRLVSTLDRRLAELSDADRRQYEAWKQRCAEHFAQHNGPPGSYFANWIDGKIERPHLPRHLERKLSGDEPQILETDSLTEAAEKWAHYREQRQ